MMKKFLVVIAVIYLLVAASRGLLHGIDLWDGPVAANLVVESISTGALWPFQLWAWFT